MLLSARGLTATVAFGRPAAGRGGSGLGTACAPYALRPSPPQKKSTHTHTHRHTEAHRGTQRHRDTETQRRTKTQGHTHRHTRTRREREREPIPAASNDSKARAHLASLKTSFDSCPSETKPSSPPKSTRAHGLEFGFSPKRETFSQQFQLVASAICWHVFLLSSRKPNVPTVFFRIRIESKHQTT